MPSAASDIQVLTEADAAPFSALSEQCDALGGNSVECDHPVDHVTDEAEIVLRLPRVANLVALRVNRVEFSI
jgi:hypothetical protein